MLINEVYKKMRHRHKAVHKCNLNIERQVFAIKTLLWRTERGQTDRQTDTGTDRQNSKN